MSLILTGDTSLVELPPDKEWSDKDGWVSTVRYRGLKEDVYAAVSGLTIPGNRISIRDETGPMAILEIRVDSALDGKSTEDKEANLPTIWTLQGNDLEKSIYTFPGIHNAGDTVDVKAKRVADMKEAATRVLQGDDALSSYLPPIPNAFGTAIALHIFLLSLASVQSYTVSQYVIRRETTLPANYSKKWATDNVGKVVTTAELTTDESVPETIKFELPTGEWLKRTPTITQQADGKFKVVNEWWHATTWDSLLYPKVHTTP